VHDGPVVVVAGGGTGGHLYPALAIADALRAVRPDVRVLFIGAERGLEARVLPERAEWHQLLPVHGVDRAHPLGSWRALTGLLVSLARVRKLFREHRPEVVVVTGGYAAAPAGIVAGLTGIPLVLQEQNSVPGAVTRALSRWASHAYIAYPEVEARLPGLAGRARLTGNPVRTTAPAPRPETRAHFGVPTDARLLLVAGGSQGSIALNNVVADAVRAVASGTLARPDELHLLWVSGRAHVDAVGGVIAECHAPAWVHAVPYLDDMPSALAAADLAVSRAGAMSTAELLIQGLPAILVPLPSAAADHQMANARSLERAGAALVAPQSELTAATLWRTVTDLLASPERLARMRTSALALARPAAAHEIATGIASMLPTVGAAT
jgi:UDP-N-acetylglucosamine--N-acetylmuramyl-(pentapeptide) pyrophosphoryl-undecaprenol N-acetylglucosamine transferase